MIRKTLKNRILNVLFILILILMALSYLTGYRIFFVATGSMEPTIHAKQFVISEKICPEDVEIGDIVAYSVPISLGKFEAKTTYIHRIIGTDPSGYFIFKGDANKSTDDPVFPEQIGYKIIFY